MGEKGPLQVRTVSGTPIEVYGRTFTPVARILSSLRHRGTIGANRVAGSGWGFVHTQPIALIETDDQGSGQDSITHPIPDRTGTVLRQMAVVALLFPLLCAAVVAVARWLHDLE